jgi:hypothetical protein
MTADVLRPCNGCGGTLLAIGRTEKGHNWIHKNPDNELVCPHIYTGKIARTVPDPEAVEKHPAVLSKQLADVINVDFVNKKRVD